MTRVVRDLPDDCFWVENPQRERPGRLYEHNRDKYNKSPTQYTVDEKSELYKNYKDTEPDIFYFNVNGISGGFVLDEDGHPKLFS